MCGSVYVALTMLSIRGQCGEELVADVFTRTEENELVTFSTEGHTEVLMFSHWCKAAELLALQC